MAAHSEEAARPALPAPLAELRTIWINAFRIFFRRFDFLHAEIAAATWPRFFVTIFTTLIVSSGLYHLALGLSYKGIYEKTLRIQFNLVGYWAIESLWSIISSTVIDIPFILLVAYLSYYWVSHTKEENAHWIQEAHSLAITWTVTVIAVRAVFLLEGVVREAIFHGMPITTRAMTEHRYSPIISFIFASLLTAPVIAYRYNLRLHGNKILNGLTGRDRWLLLGFQLLVLEGGTHFFGQFVLSLPFIVNLHQTLSRLWL